MISPDPGAPKIEVKHDIEIGYRPVTHPLVVLEGATFRSSQHPVIQHATDRYGNVSSLSGMGERGSSWEELLQCQTSNSRNRKRKNAPVVQKGALSYASSLQVQFCSSQSRGSTSDAAVSFTPVPPSTSVYKAGQKDAPRRHACEEVLQPLRRSPAAHRGHHIAHGQKVDHTTVGPHQVEGFGKHYPATAAQSLHSLCSLRGTGDSSQKGGRPRPSDFTQTRTKCHSSCSHMLCDSCESWQLVPAEDNYLVVRQVGNGSVEHASSEPLPASAPPCWSGAQKMDSEGPRTSSTPTATIAIPNASHWRTKLATYICDQAVLRPESTVPQPCVSFDSVASSAQTDGVIPYDAEPVIFCSPSLMEGAPKRGALVASADCSPFASQGITGASTPQVTDLGGGRTDGAAMQYHNSSTAHVLECAQGISVQLPDVGRQHVTASSSDEASPQLVHVLRRSDTLQRAGSLFQEHGSDGSSGKPDTDMHPVGIDDSCELPDEAVLDDSWVTVDDVLQDEAVHDSPSPSSFGQSFLRRHVYPTLRKMSPPQN